jgi:hypothetical protein
MEGGPSNRKKIGRKLVSPTPFGETSDKSKGIEINPTQEPPFAI